MSLIPLIFGRPAILSHRNGLVYLSVHDAAYLQTKAAWKRKLRELHPDRRPVTVSTYVLEGPAFGARPVSVTVRRRYSSTGRIQALLAQYRRWLESERAWYAQYGLRPPQ